MEVDEEGAPMTLKSKGKYVKPHFINLGSVLANSKAAMQVTYYNRLNTNVNTFASASLPTMLRDIHSKIKLLTETTITIDWMISKNRLVATMSVIESMLTLFARAVTTNTTQREKDEITNLLRGWEIPTILGTLLLEFQMILTHVEDLENQLDKLIAMRDMSIRVEHGEIDPN